MSAGQYPTPFNATFPAEPAGPKYAKLLDQTPEYATVQKIFKDLGAAVGLLTTSSAQRYELTYDAVTSAEATMLDAHYASAQGIYGGFTFRHPRSGALLSDVHYVSMVVDHKKTWLQSRTVILEKRPA